MKLSIICALTQNGAIGNKGGLLYYLPADLKHFKQLTTGHTILMGRKTFESLPKGALPNRRNVVVTRQENYVAPSIEVFHSIDDALRACQADEEVFVPSCSIAACFAILYKFASIFSISSNEDKTSAFPLRIAIVCSK